MHGGVTLGGALCHFCELGRGGREAHSKRAELGPRRRPPFAFGRPWACSALAYRPALLQCATCATMARGATGRRSIRPRSSLALGTRCRPWSCFRLRGATYLPRSISRPPRRSESNPGPRSLQVTTLPCGLSSPTSRATRVRSKTTAT